MWSFRRFVHLIRTEEAEVAKLRCSQERPDEQSQECASNAQRSRCHRAKNGGRRTEPGRYGLSVQYNIQDSCERVKRFLAEGVDAAQRLQGHLSIAARLGPRTSKKPRFSPESE